MEKVKKENWFMRAIRFISERINQIDIPNDNERFQELDKNEIKFVEKLDEMDNVEKIETAYKERTEQLEGREALKARYNTNVDVAEASKNARKTVREKSEKTLSSK